MVHIGDDIEKMNQRFDKLEGRFVQIEQRVNSLERQETGKFKTSKDELDVNVKIKLDKIEARLKFTEKKMFKVRI